MYLLGEYAEGTKGEAYPAAALYYNDRQPDMIYYAAQCYRRLGDEQNAELLFRRLVEYGESHLGDHVLLDYFAVSLPDLQIWEGDLDVMNHTHCHFMAALGYAGLHDEKQAQQHLCQARQLDINNIAIYKYLLIEGKQL